MREDLPPEIDSKLRELFGAASRASEPEERVPIRRRASKGANVAKLRVQGSLGIAQRGFREWRESFYDDHFAMLDSRMRAGTEENPLEESAPSRFKERILDLQTLLEEHPERFMRQLHSVNDETPIERLLRREVFREGVRVTTGTTPRAISRLAHYLDTMDQPSDAEDVRFALAAGNLGGLGRLAERYEAELAEVRPELPTTARGEALATVREYFRPRIEDRRTRHLAQRGSENPGLSALIDTSYVPATAQTPPEPIPEEPSNPLLDIWETDRQGFMELYRQSRLSVQGTEERSAENTIEGIFDLHVGQATGYSVAAIEATAAYLREQGSLPQAADQVEQALATGDLEQIGDVVESIVSRANPWQYDSADELAAMLKRGELPPPPTIEEQRRELTKKERRRALTCIEDHYRTLLDKHDIQVFGELYKTRFRFRNESLFNLAEGGIDLGDIAEDVKKGILVGSVNATAIIEHVFDDYLRDETGWRRSKFRRVSRYAEGFSPEHPEVGDVPKSVHYGLKEADVPKLEGAKSTYKESGLPTTPVGKFFSIIPQMRLRRRREIDKRKGELRAMLDRDPDAFVRQSASPDKRYRMGGDLPYEVLDSAIEKKTGWTLEMCLQAGEHAQGRRKTEIAQTIAIGVQEADLGLIAEAQQAYRAEQLPEPGRPSWRSLGTARSPEMSAAAQTYLEERLPKVKTPRHSFWAKAAVVGLVTGVALASGCHFAANAEEMGTVGIDGTPAGEYLPPMDAMPGFPEVEERIASITTPKYDDPTLPGPDPFEPAEAIEVRDLEPEPRAAPDDPCHPCDKDDYKPRIGELDVRIDGEHEYEFKFRGDVDCDDRFATPDRTLEDFAGDIDFDVRWHSGGEDKHIEIWALGQQGHALNDAINDDGVLTVEEANAYGGFPSSYGVVMLDDDGRICESYMVDFSGGTVNVPAAPPTEKAPEKPDEPCPVCPEELDRIPVEKEIVKVPLLDVPDTGEKVVESEPRRSPAPKDDSVFEVGFAPLSTELTSRLGEDVTTFEGDGFQIDASYQSTNFRADFEWREYDGVNSNQWGHFTPHTEDFDGQSADINIEVRAGKPENRGVVAGISYGDNELTPEHSPAFRNEDTTYKLGLNKGGVHDRTDSFELYGTHSEQENTLVVDPNQVLEYDLSRTGAGIHKRWASQDRTFDLGLGAIYWADISGAAEGDGYKLEGDFQWDFHRLNILGKPSIGIAGSFQYNDLDADWVDPQFPLGPFKADSDEALLGIKFTWD